MCFCFRLKVIFHLLLDSDHYRCEHLNSSITSAEIFADRIMNTEMCKLLSEKVVDNEHDTSCIIIIELYLY